MALGVEAVLPDGRIIRVGKAPRSAVGPSLLHLLLGSEGTLGVITEATLAVHPRPPARWFGAFVWDSISPGLDAIRRLVQTGARPSVVRLYDELDTGMALRSQGIEAKGCLLILAFEGHPDLIQAESTLARSILEASGGRDLGAAPAEHWWQHRYDISYQQSVVLQQPGTFLDTIEVAATWDRLMDLYLAVREALAPMALIMAHFSHVYPQGASIYFTVVGKAPGKELETYWAVWAKAMECCLEQGGTISHHHGIGRLKASWMEGEHGEGLEVIRTLKRALDPRGILNPGNMGL
jgi:alkyldihydroxyacetonephosphate synthase